MYVVWYYHTTGNTVFEGQLVGHSVMTKHGPLYCNNLLIKDSLGNVLLTLKREVNIPIDPRRPYIILPYHSMIPQGKRPPTAKEVYSFILHHGLDDEALGQCAAYKFLMNNGFPLTIKEFKTLLRNPALFRTKKYPKTYKETLVAIFALTSSIVSVTRSPNGDISISGLIYPEEVDIIALLKKAII